MSANDSIQFHYTVAANDFSRAGEASTDFKKKLRQLQIPPDTIRRITVAMYEGEINMVIHASGGEIRANIQPDQISLELEDTGPGIADVELAMQEGFSTASDAAKQMGFGAGMGLPNMKKSADKIRIDTTLAVGTTVYMTFNLP